MEDTLLDVQVHIVNRSDKSFKRLRCFVVNYTAKIDFLHKFWYNGCSVQRLNGLFCAKANCAEHRGSKRPIYRLQLQLTGQSRSRPLTVSIFYEAQKLLGMSAEKFSMRSPESQKELVREATLKGEVFDFDLRVKEDPYSGQFVAIVQKVHLLELVDEDEVINNIMNTPNSARGDFSTPRGDLSGIVGTSGGESFSQRRGSTSRSSKSNLSCVKTKLKDVLDILDLTLDDE